MVRKPVEVCPCDRFPKRQPASLATPQQARLAVALVMQVLTQNSGGDRTSIGVSAERLPSARRCPDAVQEPPAINAAELVFLGAPTIRAQVCRVVRTVQGSDKSKTIWSVRASVRSSADSATSADSAKRMKQQEDRSKTTKQEYKSGKASLVYQFLRQYCLARGTTLESKHSHCANGRTRNDTVPWPANAL
jgi:hypothetical protein